MAIIGIVILSGLHDVWYIATVFAIVAAVADVIVVAAAAAVADVVAVAIVAALLPINCHGVEPLTCLNHVISCICWLPCSCCHSFKTIYKLLPAARHMVPNLKDTACFC